MAIYENIQAEETILKMITQKKDITLLTTVNEDWLTGERQNLLNVIRMKSECMEYFYCQSYCEENNIDVSFPLISRIFKTDIDNELQSVLLILEEKYLRRQMYKVGDLILGNIERKHPLIIASDAQAQISKLRYSGEKLEKLGDTFEPDTMDLIDCGIPDMDSLYLSVKNIMILGGERGHQKTNFAIHLAAKSLERNVVHLKNEKFKIVFFSREMSFKELKARLIARLFKIKFGDVRKGNYNVKEIDKVFHEQFWYYNDNFVIVPPEKINGIEDVAKFILQEKPTIWLFDYMQLLARAISGKDGDVNSTIAWLVTRFKSIAQLTDTLGIIISTLAKYEKGRVSHVPRLEDLYSSVEIQYLATWVGLCYWSWFYDRSLLKEPFFVLWEKNRNEEPFTMPLKVIPEYSIFESLVPGTIKSLGQYLG